MIDIFDHSFVLPELTGSVITEFKVVRWPLAPHNELFLLVRFDDSENLHWIFLNGVGHASWREAPREELLDSVDDDLIVEEISTGGPLRSPVSLVEAVDTGDEACGAAKIVIRLESRAEIVFAYASKRDFHLSELYLPPGVIRRNASA